MPAIGSLRVELELEDGSFTTRIVRAGTSLATLERQAGATVTSVRGLDSGIAQVGQTISKFTLTVALARDALFNLYSVFGQWGVSILKTAGELERLNTLLGNMSGAFTEVERAVEGQKATQYLLDLSRSAPFALKDLTDGFTKLKAGGLDPMNGSFRALTDAVAAFGGNSQQLERASIAIQQMAGKGVISMEELRQQLGEAVPSALPLLARALGQTVDQLVKNISDGKVRAKPALEALFNEFDRTFGGRAQAMMTTFNGQVQQLQNVFQRLQATVAGNQGDGGFLDRSANAITRLNEALSSPEAQNFGIRLGQMLASAVDGLVATAEAAYRFREAIGQAALALGGLLAFAVGRRIFFFLIAEAAVASTQLVLLTRAITGTTTALATFVATGAITGRLTGIAAAAGFAGTALMGLVNVFAAVTRGAAATTLALLALATNPVRALSSFAALITPAFDALATRLAATTTASAALGFAMRSLFVGGAVVGGIFLIVQAVQFLIEKYNILTRDAGAAYDRIRRGATDESSVKAALDEAKLIQAEVERAQKTLEALDRLRETGKGKPALSKFDGQGAIAGVELPKAADADAFQRYYDDVRRFVTEGRNRINDAQTQAQLAGERRLEQLGQAQGSAEISRLTTQTNNIRVAYERRAAEIDAARAKTQAKLLAREITPEQANVENQQTDANALGAKLDQYQQRIDVFNSGLLAAQKRLSEAATAEARAIALAQVDAIRPVLEQLRKDMENVSKEGEGFLGGLGDQATKTKQAETAIANMVARTAELNGAMNGLGGNLERTNNLIANNKFGDLLPADMREKLLEAAKNLDAAEAATKRFQAAQQALANIDTGLNRAATDLQGYIDRINNPNLPEAQQRFITFSRQMAAELDRVRIATNGMGAAFQQAAGQAAAAIQDAQLSSVLSQTAALIEEGKRGEIQAQAPGANRAAVQLRQKREEINTARAALQREIGSYESTDARFTAAQDALAKLNQAEKGIEAGIRGSAGRADASAGAKQENALTRLIARQQELRAELAGGNTELAKQSAILEREGKSDTPYGRQVQALARDIGELEEKIKAANAATQAFEEVQRQVKESQSRQNEYATQLEDPLAAEGSRALIQFKAQQEERLRVIIAGGRDEAEARRLVTDANAGRAGELALQDAVKQRQASREIVQSLADTNAERRRLAQESLRIETAQSRSLIDASNLTEERKQAALEALANYSTAANDRIVRETESALAKMGRAWGNLGDNMDNFFASSIDRMADGLAEFATKGKIDFKSLADSIIADLIRLQIKAAASPLLGMLSKGIEAGIGGLFGGGATANTSNSAGFINQVGAGQGFYHAGGMIGSEPTFTRQINQAVFNNAPRFHTGGTLNSDEIPAILQRGEGVFTKGQMAAIGNMNRSYQFVEGAMARMVSALEAPSTIAPQTGGNVQGGGQGAMPNISVNLINQSGQQLDAMAGQPRMDLEGMVIDVVIKGMSKPGPMRDAFRGAA